MNPSMPPTSGVPNVRVSCESWREFVERYASDIGNGGLFVATDEAPALLSLVDVSLQLPEATEIVLRARVVQLLAGDAALRLGKQPGIALELLELDPERRRQISQLIDFARLQGATNDPNASFTRTLLELSPSLPPAEVGYRLSIMPGPGRRTSSADGMPALRKSGESGARRALELGNAGISRPNMRAVAPQAHPSRPSMRAVAPQAHASRPSMGAVAPEARPSRPSLPPVAAEARSASQPPASATGRPSQPPASTTGRPSQPPRPTDSLKLKQVLTDFAHKHYEAALRTTREMLEANPGDPHALRWQAMCNARLALTRKDGDSAADHYEQVLQYDPDNREARDFIKHHRREKTLHSLPFGRYFVKKK